MNQLVAAESSNAAQAVGAEDLSNFVTFVIRGQMFGIPVLKVQDILTPDHIAAIPLAPPEVKGSINLRGRIVTCIDVRVRLRLKANKEESNCMGVTVDHHGELYTLLVDQVGDVVSLKPELYESNPSTLDPFWREFAQGVFRLEGQLMVVLDVEKLLEIKG